MPITPDIFDKILEDISHSDKGVSFLCKKHKVFRRDFYNYIKENKEEADKFARAKQLQMDFLGEQIIEIADTPIERITEKSGMNNFGSYTETVKSDDVQARKLQIDTRKFVMAKLHPKKYGDKLDLTTDGEKLPVVNSQPIIQVVTNNTPFGDSPIEEIEQNKG